MSIKKLVQVAEYPTQLNGCDRLVFTNQHMLLAYVAPNMALTLAIYDRAFLQVDAPVAISVATLVPQVKQWANPTVIKINDNLLAILYEDAVGFTAKRILNLILVNGAGTILFRNPLASGSNIFSQYDYFIYDATLSVVSAGLDELSRETIWWSQIDTSSYAITTLPIWVSDTPTIINSLCVSDDAFGMTHSMVFVTNTNNVSSAIYQSDIVGGVPQAPVKWLETTGSTHILEADSITDAGTMVAIYSCLEKNATSIYPTYYYKYGDQAPSPIQFQAVESIAKPRIVPKDKSGNYFIQFLTNNISAHPRSLVRGVIGNLGVAPPNFNNLVYTYPLGHRCMGLAMGPSLLNEPDSLVDQVNSGTVLVEDRGSKYSWLCYFDPVVTPIDIVLDPDTIVNQPRGILDNPVVSGAVDLSRTINKPSKAHISAIVTNPEGMPINCLWTSNPSVTFAPQYGLETEANFDVTAPDASSITATIYYMDQMVQASMTVFMEPHEPPTFSVSDVSAYWHQRKSITVEVDHEVGFPITLTVTCPPEISVGGSLDLLNHGDEESTFVSHQASSPTSITFNLLPWHVNATGDTKVISLNVSDPISSNVGTMNINVSALPNYLLGASTISRSSYNGNLALANNHMGFTAVNSPTLYSNFSRVEKIYLDGTWNWLLFGKNAVLWINDWGTETHTYVMSYNPIKSAAVNSLGATAIATESELLVYNYPHTLAVPNTVNDSTFKLPQSLTYHDIPDIIYSLQGEIRGAITKVVPFGLNGWLVYTPEDICFFGRIDSTEVSIAVIKTGVYGFTISDIFSEPPFAALLATDFIDLSSQQDNQFDALVILRINLVDTEVKAAIIQEISAVTYGWDAISRLIVNGITDPPLYETPVSRFIISGITDPPLASDLPTKYIVTLTALATH